MRRRGGRVFSLRSFPVEAGFEDGGDGGIGDGVDDERPLTGRVEALCSIA